MVNMEEYKFKIYEPLGPYLSTYVEFRTNPTTKYYKVQITIVIFPKEPYLQKNIRHISS